MTALAASADSHHLLERARGWLDELQHLDSTANQIGRVGLMAALALAAPLHLMMRPGPALGVSVASPVQMHTHYLQGYLFSRPLPSAELEAWAARQVSTGETS